MKKLCFALLMISFGFVHAQVPVVKLKKDTVTIQSPQGEPIQLKPAGATDRKEVWAASSGNMKIYPQQLELFITNDIPQLLTVKFRPGTTGNKTVIWSSENPSIASVTSNGMVVGKNRGYTRVMAITSDNKDTAVCNVMVARSNEWGNNRDAGKGLVSSQNNWIYFANPKDGFKLYRMNFRGTELVRLSDDSPYNIQVMGRWVYFNCNDGIVQVTTDGGERKVIDNRASLIRVHQSGALYCFRENKVFKLNLNKPNQAMEVVFEEDDNVFNLNLDQYYLFYNKFWENNSVNHEFGGAYRYNWSTREKEELVPVKHIVRRFAVEENSVILYYFQAGSHTVMAPSKVFGVEVTSGGGDPVSTGMYTTTFTNKQRTEIPQIDNNTTWILINDWVYYNKGNEWRRVKAGGTMDQSVAGFSEKYELYPFGDFLLAYSADEKKIFRMLPDGRDVKQIF